MPRITTSVFRRINRSNLNQILNRHLNDICTFYIYMCLKAKFEQGRKKGNRSLQCYQGGNFWVEYNNSLNTFQTISFVDIHDVRSLIYQRRLLKNSAKIDMISSKLKRRKSCNHCFIVIWKNLHETMSKRIAIFIHPCHAPLLFHTTTLYTYIYIISQWPHPPPPTIFP